MMNLFNEYDYKSRLSKKSQLYDEIESIGIDLGLAALLLLVSKSLCLKILNLCISRMRVPKK